MVREVDWQSQESHILLNPKMAVKKRQLLSEKAMEQNLTSTLWLSSSGTESYKHGTKLVALKKDSFLVAAQAVIDHLKLTKNDVWINPLPHFHVGGLSIGARCFLSGGKEVLFEDKWNPQNFYETLEKQQGTITSLVPTQVFDLVKTKRHAPKSLRVVLLGGGAIDPNLFKEAKALGWPLLPSYGMTESAAALAIAPFDSLASSEIPGLDVLPHMEIKWHSKQEKWSLQSPCLFQGNLWVQENGDSHWQERQNPFAIDDRLEIQNKTLKVLGRESELIKILGETVNLQNLRHKISPHFNSPFEIVAIPDERRGFNLKVVIEAGYGPSMDGLNEQLLGYEKIDELLVFDRIPRTSLGKVDRQMLRQKLSASLESPLD